MQWNAKQWRQSTKRFKAFMVPLVAPLGRSERRTAATSYVQGLLMPGQRKSIEPMAARLGLESQGLQQFLADSPWDENDLWRVIRRQVLPHLQPMEAWIVDETGWLKQGQHSVGVARQYCGALGKKANCQVSVELVVSDGEMAAPVGGRLYLPQSWIEAPARCAKAGVPPEVGFATKPPNRPDLDRTGAGRSSRPGPGTGRFGLRQRL
jgi:SRSO17 transposase